MLVKTNNKWDAVRAFINTWLKDQTFYCNNCGENWNPLTFPCCENPQIGRNIDHTKGVIKQNKMWRQTRKNKHASTDDKSIRWGISMPPRLLYDLERYFKTQYNEKLFNNNKELYKFMKEFPEFCVCVEV
jgi:hypothetical protein